MKDKVHPVNAIVPSAYIIFKGSFQSGSLGQAELSAEAAPAEGTVALSASSDAMQKASRQ